MVVVIYSDNDKSSHPVGANVKETLDLMKKVLGYRPIQSENKSQFLDPKTKEIVASIAIAG